jgi:hypothetical protein
MRWLQKGLARARTCGSWRHRKAVLIALALVAGLALAVPVLRQAQDVVLAHVSAAYDLSWNVIAGGGGKMESAQYTLHGTTGQPSTGQASSSGHTLCSGFWCNGEAGDRRVYLPLVLKDSP